MKWYISLGYGVKFVHNNDRGVIQDFPNSKIFIVEKEYLEMLKKALNGLDLNNMETIYKEKWKETLNFLMLNKLIRFTREPYIKYFHDEWTAGTSIPIESDSISEIKAMYINLVSSCSLDCNACEKTRLFPCISCVKTPDSYRPNYLLNENTIIKFMIELTNHGCNQIFLTGGDPLTEFDKLIGFMDIATKFDLNFFLITNGMLLDKNKISVLKKYKLQILFQIIEDNVEYNREIENRVILLKEYNLPFRLVLNVPNKFILDEKNIRKENIIQNYPHEDLINPFKNNLMRPTMNISFMKQNKCLQFKMYMSQEGDIYPCIAFYKRSKYNLGSLKNRKLSHFIVELEKIWEDKSLQNQFCNDCILNEYCMSCIVLKEQFNNLVKCNMRIH
ncbi:radical SAM protein [Petrotoga sp. 9T1HF07.CasAA.8.2]|jgi:radical SAM protein with 4Fe4S-binding SPASM domain|uniref:radical SAM/SPASM domain-containing protein n=2 Tax=Petrotoga TaxID=28236 RepID=UPI000CB07CCA|nr:MULTISPECIES: radical SAM/SPASM domain-containing protein [unclassified Petrotoga]PNR89065.1 radical SAM protein [Petrotoga sp. 9T1HF07.CasAA.8.2]